MRKIWVKKKTIFSHFFLYSQKFIMLRILNKLFQIFLKSNYMLLKGKYIEITHIFIHYDT